MTRLDNSNLVQLTDGRRSERLHHYPACGGYQLIDGVYVLLVRMGKRL